MRSLHRLLEAARDVIAHGPCSDPDCCKMATENTDARAELEKELENENVELRGCWCVWIRRGWSPDGPWIALGFTYSATRSGSIQKFDAGWDGPGGYQRRRRKGLVRAVRSSMVPVQELPE